MFAVAAGEQAPEEVDDDPLGLLMQYRKVAA